MSSKPANPAPASGRPRIGLIWAEAEGGVIGRDGGMPWHVPEDLAHFKEVTLGAPVIMGRKTWDSLNPRFRPLPGRRNIVVTRQRAWRADGAEVASSVESALDLAHGVDRVWVIGGAELFAAVIGIADRLEVTELRHADGGFAPADGDVLAPAIPAGLEASREGERTSTSGIRYRFVRFAASARPDSL
ncbi:dihydrofolate reductase [Agromyces sp. Marseille-Q5079]|uniref:dihydrofolate reductase n=1 Tax=Agromyces sp. Marseille-Q5079 TaxID=3439059 RepID=UPI003D9C8ED2